MNDKEAVRQALYLLTESAEHALSADRLLRQLVDDKLPEFNRKAVCDAIQMAYDFMRMPAFQFAGVWHKGSAYNADESQAIVQKNLREAMKEMGMEVKP